jgi:hypothetical protein
LVQGIETTMMVTAWGGGRGRWMWGRCGNVEDPDDDDEGRCGDSRGDYLAADVTATDIPRR